MSPALRVERLRSIEAELRRLRAQVVEVGAPQTADKIRSAIKSIGGAIRHAQRVGTVPGCDCPAERVAGQYKELRLRCRGSVTWLRYFLLAESEDGIEIDNFAHGIMRCRGPLSRVKGTDFYQNAAGQEFEVVEVGFEQVGE